MGEEQGESNSPLGFIHRFVPSRERPPPITLLLLHGTGGNEDDLLQLGHELSSKAALLSPRGKALENGMPRFFRRLAEGVFDIDDLVFRTRELADFAEAASRIYGFDPERVVAVGYSNGANIASSLLLLSPGALAGGVLLRPMVSFVPKKLPDLSDVNVLIAGGLKDQIVPREQTEKLLDIFKRCHADAKLHWEDSTHAIAEGEIQFAKEWLSKHF